MNEDYRVFQKKDQNVLQRYIFSNKKATKIVLIWLERRNPSILFKCRMGSEECTVADICAKLFGISNYQKLNVLRQIKE